MNDDLLRELALLRDLGYTHLDLSSARAIANAETLVDDESMAAPALFGSAPSVAAEASASFVAPNRRLDAAACSSLDELRPIVMPCTRCRLAETRKQVVFGVGSPDADLMFIGEAPGRDEDMQGEPFVGRAGQLLTDIIKAMKLTRDQVYIANVIKCRPPENRNPEPDELEACRPYIRKQIELIAPKVIVTLGRYSLQSLTERSYGITSVRGQWLEYNGIKVMPTYHPAYLLRTPAAKKDVWSDMKKVMAELGLTF